MGQNSRRAVLATGDGPALFLSPLTGPISDVNPVPGPEDANYDQDPRWSPNGRFGLVRLRGGTPQDRLYTWLLDPDTGAVRTGVVEDVPFIGEALPDGLRFFAVGDDNGSPFDFVELDAALEVARRVRLFNERVHSLATSTRGRLALVEIVSASPREVALVDLDRAEVVRTFVAPPDRVSFSPEGLAGIIQQVGDAPGDRFTVIFRFDPVTGELHTREVPGHAFPL